MLVLRRFMQRRSHGGAGSVFARVNRVPGYETIAFPGLRRSYPSVGVHSSMHSAAAVSAPNSSAGRITMDNRDDTSQKVHPLDDSAVESYTIPGAKVFDRYFECPLDYSKPDGSKITVFARHLVPYDKADQVKKLPFFLYLQGGPGFEVAPPSSASSGWIKAAFEKGFQVLLLDQRGTGQSSAVSARALAHLESDEAKRDYLLHFRADNIVRDCETIRKALTENRCSADDCKLTLLGQSFGGFCIVTYLSLFPQSIREAYITGGVPPLVNSPDPVYRALYPRMLKKNKLYYQKYPRDVERVRHIHAHLSTHHVTLPDGGTLSPRRFLQLGLLFGGSGGYDTLHQTILSAATDLDRLGQLSFRTLSAIQSLQSFDTNVFYCILHESIYCQGEPSQWTAEKLLMEEPFKSQFEWRLDALRPDQPIYFTGETVYPFMLDDYVELRPLKNVANLLAEFRDWPKLYDEAVLAKNTVPVAGVSYFEDMYVDVRHSEETASKINGFQQWITNEFAHNGLRVDGERIVKYLAKLASGEESYNR
ncbi:Alpha/Beta hydrolase protein [Dichotomocladium elegans]|nr:Alpha/Beta hydrolase protein [Dichotomocladium elegans]